MVQEINDVPKNDVGNVVQDFLNTGSENVTVTPEGNDRYTVRGQ